MRQIIAILWIVPLATLSLLALVRAPVYALWKPAVGIIEFGHVVAVLLILGCLLPDPKAKSSVWLWAAALVGMMFVLTPWLRASFQAPAVASNIAQVFGSKTLATKTHKGQQETLSLKKLWRFSSEKVAVKTIQVEVAKGHTLPLDLYQVGVPTKPQPLVVVIHGGGWANGDRTQLPGINHYLALRGVTVASISYRLAPKHHFPTQIDDVTAMVKWLQANAATHHIDPTRVVLYGRSAGGHLALLAAYRKAIPNIRGVIAFYPVTDLNWSWRNPANPWVIDTPGTLSDFIGGTPTTKPKAYEEASPLNLVGPTSPATLLVHGGRDELVSLAQSQRLAAKLSTHKVAHALVSMPWASHGCEVSLSGPSGQLSLYAIERFLTHVFR